MTATKKKSVIKNPKALKKFMTNYPAEKVIQALDGVQMPEWLDRCYKVFNAESTEVSWYYYLAEKYVSDNGLLKGVCEARALWKEAGFSMKDTKLKKELDNHIRQMDTYDWGMMGESGIYINGSWKNITETELYQRKKLWSVMPSFDANDPMFSMGNFLMIAVNSDKDLMRLANTSLITVSQTSRYFFETLLPWFQKTAKV